MRLKLKQLFDFLISNPQNGEIMAYDSSSKKWKNVAKPKTKYGSVTVGSNGTFTIDLTSAGFTSTPTVVVSARATTATVGDRNFACISTVSTTTATGYASNSKTIRVQSVYTLTNSPSGTIVDYVATGM